MFLKYKIDIKELKMKQKKSMHNARKTSNFEDWKVMNRTSIGRMLVCH